MVTRPKARSLVSEEKIQTLYPKTKNSSWLDTAVCTTMSNEPANIRSASKAHFTMGKGLLQNTFTSCLSMSVSQNGTIFPIVHSKGGGLRRDKSHIWL